MTLHDADDLTPSERSAFAGLTREHLGSAELEERVVESLRDRGLLHEAATAWRGLRWWRGAVSAAAGILLLAVGAYAGRHAALRSTAGAMNLAMDTLAAPGGAITAMVAHGDTMDAAQLGRALQRVGSEYVALLTLLPSSDTATMAFQVARATLLAAANQVARRAPSDAVAAAIVRRGTAGLAVAGASDRAMIIF